MTLTELDRLAEACRAVASGGRPEELQNLLDEIEQTVETSRAEFSTAVGDLQSSVRHGCEGVINRCYAALDWHATTVKSIRQATEKADTAILLEQTEQTRYARQEVEDSFYAFRQAALMGLGPTRVPGANLILQTLSRLQQGEDVVGLIQTQSDREYAIVTTLFELLESQGPEAAEPLPCIRSYLAVVAETAHVQEPIDPYSLEDLATRMAEAATLMEEALTALEIRRMQAAPTPFPQANILVHLVRQLLDNSEVEAAVRSTLGGLQRDLDGMRQRQQLVLSNPETSAAVGAAAADMGSGLDTWGQALAFFEEVIGNLDADVLRQATENLEAASVELDRFSRTLADLADQEGKVPCFRCGHYSRPDRPLCEKCGARLPISADLRHSGVDVVMSEDSPVALEPEPVMTENVYRLLEAVNRAADGSLSPAEFEPEVSRMEQLLAEARASGDPVEEVPADIREGYDKARGLFRQALNDCDVGLSMFRDFAQGGGGHNLITGSQMLLQGVASLQKMQYQLELIQPEEPTSDKVESTGTSSPAPGSAPPTPPERPIWEG